MPSPGLQAAQTLSLRSSTVAGPADLITLPEWAALNHGPTPNCCLALALRLNP